MSTQSPSRLQCSVFIAVSIDGYIARPDGGVDWLSTVEWEGEDYGYKRFIDTVDTVVLGRNTYDAVLRFDSWPFDDKRCVVMTHRPAAARHGEQLFSGKPEALVDQLAKSGARHVYVDGGSAIRAFLAARLIDRMTISVVPIVLGTGIPLFTPGVQEHWLVLEESRAFSTGLMQLRYRVARDVRETRAAQMR